jgi:hypothetical protein
MSRASLGARVWYEVVVPIFLERFLLYLCAGAVLGFVINNGMGLDIHQRIGLGIALVGIAYFLGHTAYKAKLMPSIQTQSPTDVVAIPKSVTAPAPLNPEMPKQIAPSSKSLWSEIVNLHAEGLAFLMARDINMPTRTPEDQQKFPDDPQTIYNSQTGSKFMEQFGARLIALRSRMIDSKTWSAKMEKFYRDLNFSFESRIAATELLNEMEEAARKLK